MGVGAALSGGSDEPWVWTPAGWMLGGRWGSRPQEHARNVEGAQAPAPEGVDRARRDHCCRAQGGHPPP